MIRNFSDSGWAKYYAAGSLLFTLGVANAVETVALVATDAAMKAAPPKAAARVKSPNAKSPQLPPPRETLPPEVLTITLGEIRLLPINGKISRVAIGTGTLVSTTAVDSSLLLIAEQVGATSLMVWTDRVLHTYQVRVVPKNLNEVLVKINALISNIPTIAVTQVGTQFVLSGVAHKDILRDLSTSLNDPSIVFNVREDQGSPYTRSVLFRLHFVEVKTSVLEQIGINWGKSVNGPILGFNGVAKNEGVFRTLAPAGTADSLLNGPPQFVMRNGNSGGVFLGLAATLTSRINLGIADGDAHVLASPELTAKSGGKARLQVGGEVPIPLSGAFGSTTVEFKPFGIIFSIEPFIDGNNIITAKVSTELSQIDPAVSVNGIPGFITRNTSTEISVKPGEMVALSGLINSELSNSIDRVPGLSRVPFFGKLFSSDDFKKRKTELVVLVETEIISAGDGLAQQLLNRGTENMKLIESKVEAANKPAQKQEFGNADDSDYRRER